MDFEITVGIQEQDVLVILIQLSAKEDLVHDHPKTVDVCLLAPQHRPIDSMLAQNFWCQL